MAIKDMSLEELDAQIAVLTTARNAAQKKRETEIKNASASIAENLKKIQILFDDCERLADLAKITFHWDGPTYGTGASYSDGEWNSSSSNC